MHAACANTTRSVKVRLRIKASGPTLLSVDTTDEQQNHRFHLSTMQAHILRSLSAKTHARPELKTHKHSQVGARKICSSRVKLQIKFPNTAGLTDQDRVQ